MCYNGYNENQYLNQYPYSGQYPNQYPDQYLNHCGCPIYPIPFMPVNPLYANAYVPYQTYGTTYPLGEALNKGSLFQELVGIYDPYTDYSKLKGCWDQTGYWKGDK